MADEHAINARRSKIGNAPDVPQKRASKLPEWVRSNRLQSLLRAFGFASAAGNGGEVQRSGFS